MRPLLILLLSLALASCDAGDLRDEASSIPEAEYAAFDPGARVITTAAGTLFKTSTVIPAGAAGTAGSNRDKSGTEYTFVAFDIYDDGYLPASILAPEDGGPPPPPPSGDFMLGVFGCSSSARDVLDGAKRVGRYDYWAANPAYSGKTIHSYGDPDNFADQYAAGWAAVEQGFAANPGTDAVAYGICTRYSNQNLPGARTLDVPYPLPAGQSGSPTKSEMQMIEHIADRIAATHPGLPFSIFALHEYENGANDWTCERVGTQGIEAMEAMADQSAANGWSLPMLLANGSTFRLGPLNQAAGHIKEDGCHATPAGEEWLINKPDGLDAWLDNVAQ